jgi:hypothetical protein
MGTSVPGYVGQRHAGPRAPIDWRWLRRMGVAAVFGALVLLGAAVLFGLVLLIAVLTHQ